MTRGRSFLIPILPILFAGVVPLASAQPAGSPEEWANFREEVRGLSERVGELTLRVEQLEHENAELRGRNAGQVKDAVSQAQLNAAVAELNLAIQSAVGNSRQEILEKVATQMEKLARETNAALDSISKGSASATSIPIAASPSAPTGSSDSGSPAKAPVSADSTTRAGSYKVQRGDSLVSIAKRNGLKVQDLIDANKLSDPSHIQVGQTLILPGGK